MFLTSTLCVDLGAAYGTAKSGVGICSMGVLKPDLIFKSIVPIIMAGILGIYGLIVAVILNGKGKATDLLSNSPFLLNTPCSSTLNWKLHIRHGIQAPRLRTDLRSLLPRSWFRYRHCWRRWCESKRTIGSNLRWHDPYSHLR